MEQAKVFNRIMECIPISYENRISRSELVSLTGYTDRAIREAIQSAPEHGFIVINLDGGYFIPAETLEDMMHLNEYLAREYHRVHAMKDRLGRIRKLRRHGTRMV